MARLKDFQARGPPRGYFLDLTKILLVVASRNVDRGEEFFREMGLQVVTGSRYLGGFIRDRAAEKSWLARKVEGWAESVGNLAGVSHKHPQSAYARIQKSLQKECEFMKWVTPGIGDALGLVKKAQQETFFPALFKGLGYGAP